MHPVISPRIWIVVLLALAGRLIHAEEPKREQIGTVLGKPVYRDQVNREGHGNLAAQVHEVFHRPVQRKYLEDHKAELEFTDAEIVYFTHAGDEMQTNQHNSLKRETDAPARTIRNELAEIEARLASDKLTDDERQEAVLQKGAVEKRFQTLVQKNRELVQFQAEHFFIGPKLARHLYEKYGGGRVSRSKFGIGAFDAYDRWVAERESLGEFEITDAKMRAEVRQQVADDRAAWDKKPRRGTSSVSDKPEDIRMVLNPPFLPPRKKVPTE